MSRRIAYARLYLLIDTVTKEPLLSADGRAEAFTDWEEASCMGSKVSRIVTTFEFFRDRILPTMAKRPCGLRITAKTADRPPRHYVYHAELDAKPEEIATLNDIRSRDHERAPKQIAAQLRKAKVWREDSPV